jgi:Flp pilus assembly protein TadD
MKKIWQAVSLAAFFAATAGCAGNATRTEMDYTTSYKLAIANQTLYPEAARNEAPVTGMQAPEASKVYERYIKSFEKPTGSEQSYIIPLAAQGGAFSSATR